MAWRFWDTPNKVIKGLARGCGLSDLRHADHCQDLASLAASDDLRAGSCGEGEVARFRTTTYAYVTSNILRKLRRRGRKARSLKDASDRRLNRALLPTWQTTMLSASIESVLGQLALPRLFVHQRRAGTQYRHGLIDHPLNYVSRRGNVAYEIHTLSSPDDAARKVIVGRSQVVGFRFFLLAL